MSDLVRNRETLAWKFIIGTNIYNPMASHVDARARTGHLFRLYLYTEP